MLKKGETYTGAVEKNVWGGKGFLKNDEQVVLIKGAIEGQVVEYRVEKTKKQYAEAVVEKVITPSSFELPEREKKNTIPGCEYQDIRYEKQLEIKHGQLQEIFRNFPEISLPAVLPSPQIFGYRNKMEFSCGFETQECFLEEGNKKWNDSGLVLGFHPPQDWAKVIRIDDVFIASRALNFLRQEIEVILQSIVENYSGEKDVRPWNARIHTGLWRGLIMRESAYSQSIIVNFLVSEESDASLWEELVEEVLSLHIPENKKISGIIRTVHTGKSDAIVNPQVSVLWGSELLEEKLGESVFEISPFSFFQTNTLGAELLYSTVRKKIGETSGKNVLDLFCGTGSIGIFCASNAKKIVGIEMIQEAVAVARKNAEKNNVTNAEFYAEKVEKVLPEILQKDSFDTIIVDPPRSGVHPKALQYLAQIPVKKLVYVSCNPSTLERDVRALEMTQKWRLVEVQGVDMFPHTSHLEIVSVIERIDCS
jgi:23S rRNA (uracil-5-)-methyltransferase RumA